MYLALGCVLFDQITFPGASGWTEMRRGKCAGWLGLLWCTSGNVLPRISGGSKIKVLAGLPRAVRASLFVPLSWLLLVCWHCLVSLACRYLILTCSLTWTSHVQVCVQVSPCHQDMNHNELGAHPTLGWPHLNQSYLQWPYFQIRWHSKVLGVRASTYEFWGGYSSTCNGQQCGKILQHWV